MDAGFALLGLATGTLVGMTGVGAGSLVTPALALSGVPPALAVGTDLAHAALAKPFGALVHRAQRTLDVRVAARLAAGSVPAAAVALALLSMADAGARGAVVSAFLALALVLTALALLAGRTRLAAFAARHDARVAPLRAPLTVAAGALLGVVVTLSSVGAGALGAVLLVALHPTMPAARIAGADIAHAVPLTLVAAAGHLWLGHVDFGLAANLAAGSVPGIVAGSLLAGRLPDALVRRLLALALLAAGARLAAAAV
jgi:hypothetical protein